VAAANASAAASSPGIATTRLALPMTMILLVRMGAVTR
jgi:hypothetical protein